MVTLRNTVLTSASVLFKVNSQPSYFISSGCAVHGSGSLEVYSTLNPDHTSYSYSILRTEDSVQPYLVRLIPRYLTQPYVPLSEKTVASHIRRASNRCNFSQSL